MMIIKTGNDMAKSKKSSVARKSSRELNLRNGS